MREKFTYRRAEICKDYITLIPYSDEFGAPLTLETQGQPIPITELSAEKITINDIKLSTLHPELKFNARNVHFFNVEADISNLNLSGCKFVNMSFSNPKELNQLNIYTTNSNAIVFENTYTPIMLMLSGWQKVHFVNCSKPRTLVVDKGAIVSGIYPHQTRKLTFQEVATTKQKEHDHNTHERG